MYPGFRWKHKYGPDTENVCEILTISEKGCVYRSRRFGVLDIPFWTPEKVKRFISAGLWIPLQPSTPALLKALKDAISTNSLS